MKYIIVLGDGMADEPIPSLDNKTPLECAKTPSMDDLSKKGEMLPVLLYVRHAETHPPPRYRQN